MKTEAYQSVSEKLGQLQKQKTFSNIARSLKLDRQKLNKHCFSEERGKIMVTEGYRT